MMIYTIETIPYVPYSLSINKKLSYSNEVETCCEGYVYVQTQKRQIRWNPAKFVNLNESTQHIYCIISETHNKEILRQEHKSSANLNTITILGESSM
jgi:hypothetical protein